MIHIRKTLPACLGAITLLAGASTVWAQAEPLTPNPSEAGTPAPSSDQADAEARQALDRSATAMALGTQPIAADQLALGDRFIKAMDVRAGLDEALKQKLAPVRDMILQSLANAPPENKAKFIAAVDEALAGVRGDMLVRIVRGLTRYYAARLTTAQLTGALAFYESPLGQKSVRAPQTLTSAEKQEAGLYMLRHDEILDVLGASIGSLEVSQALTAREMSGLADRFKARLCAAIKPRGLTSTNCPKA